MLEKLSGIVKRKYDILYKKLDNLKNNKFKCNSICKPRNDTFAFHEPIKNLSNISFTQEELDHFEKGYISKFMQPS